MDPFTIMVRKEGKPIVLAIQPKDKLSFAVHCEEVWVGEIFLYKSGKAWGAITTKPLGNTIAADTPTNDCPDLLLDPEMVQLIGVEISSKVRLIL